MKNAIKISLCFLMFAFSATVFAVQWDVAAYIWTGTAIAVTAATMVAAAPIAIAYTFSIGFTAGVLGLYWDGPAQTTSTGQQASKGISVVLDPNTPLITPDGWTAPSPSPQNQDLNPTPPNTAQPTGKFSITRQFSTPSGFACNGGTSFSNGFCKLQGATLAEVLHKYKTNNELRNPDIAEANMTYSYDSDGDCLTQDGECTGDVIEPPECPTGYGHRKTNDGGWIKIDKNNVICDLDDPSKAEKPADEICEVRVKNGVFKTMQNDPDCGKSVVAGLNTNQISAGTTQKSTYLVTTPSNDVTVYDKQYTESSNKTTSTIAHFNPDGVVNSIQTLHSVGNQVGTTPGQTNPSNGNTNDGVTTGGGSTGSTSSGGGSGLTANDVGNILDDKLGKVFDATGDFDNKGEPDEPSNLSAPLVDFLNPLKNMQLPTSSGVCPTATFNLFNKTFVMNQQCDLFEAHKQTLKSAFSLIYLIIAFRIILSA